MKRYIKSNLPSNYTDSRLMQSYRYKGYIIQQAMDAEVFPFSVRDTPTWPHHAEFRTYDEAKKYVDSLEAQVAVSSSTNDDREFEYISYLSGLGDIDSIQRKQKQYIYRCVSESPQVPDVDTDGEEAWSEYSRDASEYKTWCFVDAVDLGIFTENEESLFNELWDRAETDMAQPYA